MDRKLIYDKFVAAMELRKKNVSLIQETLTRYFEGGDRSDEIVCKSLKEFKIEGEPEKIPEMLKRKKLHEEDYLIFRAFTNTSETILDIGASWGYSAGSIWTSGANCNIISFEPLELCKDCLEQIHRLKPERYDFIMMGLGAEPGIVRFVTPVVNGTAITSLTSADPLIYKKGLPQNIRSYIDRWVVGVQDITLRLYEFHSHIGKLDDEINKNTFSVPVEKIAAIKIDAECLEGQILQGALDTLKIHKPLVMVEGGNRIPGVQEMLSSIGYSYKERSGEILIPVSGTTSSTNGFFVHSQNIERYRNAGILHH